MSQSKQTKIVIVNKPQLEPTASHSPYIVPTHPHINIDTNRRLTRSTSNTRKKRSVTAEDHLERLSKLERQFEQFSRNVETGLQKHADDVRSQVDAQLLGLRQEMKMESRRLGDRVTNISCDGALKTDQRALQARFEAELHTMRAKQEGLEEVCLQAQTRVEELLRFRAEYERFLSDLIDSGLVELVADFGRRCHELEAVLNTGQNASRVAVDEVELRKRKQESRNASSTTHVSRKQHLEDIVVHTPSRDVDDGIDHLASPAGEVRTFVKGSTQGKQGVDTQQAHFPWNAAPPEMISAGVSDRPVNISRHASPRRPNTNTPHQIQKSPPRYNKTVSRFALLYKQFKKKKQSQTATGTLAGHDQLLIKDFLEKMDVAVSAWLQERLAEMFPNNVKLIPPHPSGLETKKNKKKKKYQGNNSNDIVLDGLTWENVDTCIRNSDWTWLD